MILKGERYGRSAAGRKLFGAAAAGEEKGESRGIVTLVHQGPAMDTLNARQQEAAQFGSGPLLIIAGAGTGKTNTLAHRVAHLVMSGARPERILLLTFTRRAALEMTRRTQRIWVPGLPRNPGTPSACPGPARSIPSRIG